MKMNSMKKEQLQDRNSYHSYQDFWSPEIAAYGFTAIPNPLIENFVLLGISDKEFFILMCLMKFMFYKKTAHPSIGLICGYTGQGYSTVQKKLATLESKGLIKRRFVNGSSTVYDITPTIIKTYGLINTNKPLQNRKGVASKMRDPPTSELKHKKETRKRSINKNETENIKLILKRSSLANLHKGI